MLRRERAESPRFRPPPRRMRPGPREILAAGAGFVKRYGIGKSEFGRTHVDQGRHLSPDALQIRPSGHARPPDHPPPPRAAFAHPRHLAFAAREPGRAFRQPPAGPLRQLARPLRLSRARARIEDRGRSRRRHDGLQSVRLLRRGDGRGMAVRLSFRSRRGSLDLHDARAGRPPAQGLPRHDPARARAPSISSSGSMRASAGKWAT